LQQLSSGVLHREDTRAFDHENDYMMILFLKGLQITPKIA